MRKLFLFMVILLCAGMASAANYGSKWTNPPVKQVAVTESDATIYDPPLVSLFVGTAGVLRVILAQDVGTLTCATAPDHANIANASLFRGRIVQVCAAGTDATDLIGYVYDARSIGE